jgi:hypothetical protein
MTRGPRSSPSDSQRTSKASRPAVSLGSFGTVLGSVKGILGVAGPLAVVVGAVVVLVFPKLRGLGFSIFAFGGILLLVLVILWLLRPHNRVARRRQRYGGTASVAVVALVGIVALVNLIFVNNNVLVDMTASRQFSLAPQTLGVLADRLKEPVTATAFFIEPNDDQDPLEVLLTERMEQYLREFARRSGGNFSYRVVDPERYPDIANQKEVTRWPAVVFEDVANGKRQGVPATGNPEQDFLTAILVVSGLDRKAVYLLDGYSSWSLTNTGADTREAIGFATQGIGGDNYAVKSLNLLQQPEIPGDASAVVVVAPNREMGNAGAEALDAYLRRGGNLMVLLEPNPPQSWRDLIGRWGLDVLDGYVVDPASHVNGEPTTPLIEQDKYLAPAITPQMDVSFFPGLTPLGLLRPPEEMSGLVDLSVFAVVSDVSFATDDPERTSLAETDVVGSFIVGAMIEALGPVNEPLPAPGTTSPATVAVFGDADFVSNRYFYAFSNGDLFLNVLNSMTGEEALVSVRPKPIVFREMAMTPQEFAFVRYTGWFFLPLLVAAAGTVVWWRRR